MQIRRIDIRDFRKIVRREITDLADGLNILVGDNEAGKSTMLAALRAAFFERHRIGGAVAEAMQPYGSAVRPTVSVDFELDGKPWSLTKSYCQRPEASLEGPGERYVGDAVEDRLAELFGFTPPGRGPSKPDEHHGTHGLLWVEQGMRPNLGVGAGRDTLAAALEREVGQVTGGERGRLLVAAAEERREQFWDKRDRPRGAVVEVRRRLEELEGEQAALKLRQREDEARLARLETLGDLLARHRRDDHLGRALRAIEAARGDVQAAMQSRTSFEAAGAVRREAERVAADALARREHRLGLAAKRQAARATAEKAAETAGEAGLLVRQRASAAGEADERLSAARVALRAAEDRLRQGQAARQHQEAEAVFLDLSAKLTAADEQAEKRHAALGRAEAVKIDAKAIAELVALERAMDRAIAELDAASVRIVFEPQGAHGVFVDGVAHPPQQPLGLARDAVLDLEGFGRLRLQPGGGAAALARKSEDAGRALRDALARLDVASVSEARQQLQERAEAQSEAAAIAKTLDILAPSGLERLRVAFGEAQARVRGSEAASSDVPVDEHTLGRAISARNEAHAAVEAIERVVKSATLAHQQAATEAATLTERRDNAARHAEALSDELSAARRGVDDDLLASRLVAASASVASALSEESAAAAAFAASNAETAQLALERAERAEREIRRDLAALEGEQRDLQVELRALGQDGVGARLEELADEIMGVRNRLASLEREAAASRLLHDTLLAAQRESKERWLGPVRERIAPYLRLIHPDGEVRIDDRTLEIEGLYRDGVLESFGALSMGAREQVAVVTRLALADILRASGHPAAVILDDALVNTDDVRLDRMRNVLTRAARTLQILIFTCRERDFLGLGATHRI